jgi:AcrR family transcriptional regulator
VLRSTQKWAELMGQRGRPRGFDRDAALRKAMETFWKYGYDGASMTRLTTAMGIASPSLYACFGSKEALFRQAVELYGSTVGAAAQRALEEAPTPMRASARCCGPTSSRSPIRTGHLGAWFGVNPAPSRRYRLPAGPHRRKGRRAVK